MIFEALMTGILAYQVMMPAVNNGRYQIVYDGQGLVRMNTQDGTMERCTPDLKCEKEPKKSPPELDYKY